MQHGIDRWVRVGEHKMCHGGHCTSVPPESDGPEREASNTNWCRLDMKQFAVFGAEQPTRLLKVASGAI